MSQQKFGALIMCLVIAFTTIPAFVLLTIPPPYNEVFVSGFGQNIPLRSLVTLAVVVIVFIGNAITFVHVKKGWRHE